MEEELTGMGEDHDESTRSARVYGGFRPAAIQWPCDGTGVWRLDSTRRWWRSRTAELGRESLTAGEGGIAAISLGGGIHADYHRVFDVA
jgi:hypothetical protein